MSIVVIGPKDSIEPNRSRMHTRGALDLYYSGKLWSGNRSSRGSLEAGGGRGIVLRRHLARRAASQEGERRREDRSDCRRSSTLPCGWLGLGRDDAADARRRAAVAASGRWHRALSRHSRSSRSTRDIDKGCSRPRAAGQRGPRRTSGSRQRSLGHPVGSAGRLPSRRRRASRRQPPKRPSRRRPRRQQVPRPRRCRFRPEPLSRIATPSRMGGPGTRQSFRRHRLWSRRRPAPRQFLWPSPSYRP